MRPFQEFRFWLRRAPAGERALTGFATVIVVALVAWLLVPDSTDGDGAQVSAFGGTAVEGAAPGAGGGGATVAPGGVPVAEAGTAAAAPAAAAPSGGTATGAPAGGASSAGGAAPSAAAAQQGCASPPGNANGITAGEVRIAVALTEIVGPAANSLFNVPPPDEAKADFEAVIAGINREGGVACRKLVARYYNVNPANESQMMEVCREIGDGGVFAVVDTGGMATRPAVMACLGQRKVPYFGAFYITEAIRRQFHPYIFSFYTKEQLYKSTTFALRDLGFFDPAKGFKKLGFIYKDCEREAITAFRGWIREVVPDAQVVTYSVGCPAVFASEADLAQAVLTFQREGVTHVIPGNFQGDLPQFTNHAERQNFRPRYGLPNEAYLSIASGTRAPNPANIANALAITQGRDAEQQTPGMTRTAGTQRCDAYYRAAGQPTVWEQVANAGHACDQLWMLQAGLSRAPELSGAAVHVGLQRTKSIDFAYPQGPNDFSGSGVTTGGQFWRVAQFMPSCNCWHVVQRDFRKGY